MLAYIKHLFKTAGTVMVAGITFVVSLMVGMVIVVMFIAIMIAASKSPDPEKKFSREVVYGPEEAKNAIASIPITGVILGERGELGVLDEISLGTVVYGYEVKEALYELAEEASIKGVVLEIHSPGGTIYGTQAIVDGVEYYRKRTGNPVIAYVGSIAASGGYWAAVSADLIIADHGTMVGSIGVIMGPFVQYSDVMADAQFDTRGGIQYQFITAGEHKDVGNPFREIDAKELEVLQRGADDNYASFVAAVADRRAIDQEKIRTQITALPYGEMQAKELGLIDEIGSKHTSYEKLAQEVQIDGDDFKVEQVKLEKGAFDSFFGATLEKFGLAPTPQVKSTSIQLCSTPSVLAYSGQNLAELCKQ